MCNNNVECMATKTGELYLVNTTEMPILFPAGELFGFGAGSFEEKVAGHGF